MRSAATNQFAGSWRSITLAVGLMVWTGCFNEEPTTPTQSQPTPSLPAVTAPESTASPDVTIEQIEQWQAQGKGGVDRLTQTLHSGVAMHRARAAFALGVIGPDASDAAPRLAELGSDVDAVVRLEAAYALGRVSSKTEVPVRIMREVQQRAQRNLDGAATLGVSKSRRRQYECMRDHAGQLLQEIYRDPESPRVAKRLFPIEYFQLFAQ